MKIFLYVCTICLTIVAQFPARFTAHLTIKLRRSAHKASFARPPPNPPTLPNSCSNLDTFPIHIYIYIHNICFDISAEQIAYKRIWNILFHFKVMAFKNSYRVAKLYKFSNKYQAQLQAIPVLSSLYPSLISFFIFYLPRCTLPDFPAVSSLANDSLYRCKKKTCDDNWEWKSSQNRNDYYRLKKTQEKSAKIYSCKFKKLNWIIV